MIAPSKPSLVALLVLAAASVAVAKPCRRLCRDEIAACRADCAGSGRGARRRCRVACAQTIVGACRRDPTPMCQAPPPPMDPPVGGGDPNPPPPPSPPPPCADCGTNGADFDPAVHLTSAGVDRTYARSVPSDYDSSHAYPVVFGFHGDGGTGASVRDALAIENHAGGAAIFVYPDATEDSGRSFDLETPLASNADMRLVLDVLDDLDRHYHVDRSRVFAAGFSRGAYFANFLNCRLGSTVLRAIAAHSGSGPYGAAADFDQDGHFMCEAPAAAALMIQGTADAVVPIDDARYGRWQWTWENQCSDQTTPIMPAPCVQYDGCNVATPVTWCEIPGLGHAVWDDAGEAIWTFFAQFGPM